MNKHLQCLVSTHKIIQQKIVCAGNTNLLSIFPAYVHITVQSSCFYHKQHYDNVLYSVHSNSGYKRQNSDHAIAHYCKVILSTTVAVAYYISSVLQCIYMLHTTNTSFDYVPTAQGTSLCHTNTSFCVQIILNYTWRWGKREKQKQNLKYSSYAEIFVN
jgi:hypothetical protein